MVGNYLLSVDMLDDFAVSRFLKDESFGTGAHLSSSKRISGYNILRVYIFYNSNACGCTF